MMGPESLPALIDATGAKDGVLRALYGDLAAPGIRQVGKALETVLQTGNIVLLPLRMLNKHVEEFEKQNFQEIADRMKRIEDDDVLDVRPEIGVPIIEALSRTTDRGIRDLFLELLAKAADKKTVELAHPSFVKVIECLTPDEGRMLAEWADKSNLPFVAIFRMQEEGSYRKVYEPVMEHPDNLIAPSMFPAYISNLVGLGLISYNTDRWLTKPDVYDDILNHIKKKYPDIKDNSTAKSISEMKIGVPLEKDLIPKAGDLFYDLGVIEILPYGKAFQKACITLDSEPAEPGE